MKKQTGSTGFAANSPRILPRFGLKLMFAMLTTIGIAAAWLFQPQITCSATCDLTKLEAFGVQRAKTAAALGVSCGTDAVVEDHCIRIRTPRIITDALTASADLKAFAKSKSAKPVEWIYEHLEVVPVGKFKLRVTAVGKASDAKELQHLAEALSEAYRDFLQNGETANSLVKVTRGKPGWRVNWRSAR